MQSLSELLFSIDALPENQQAEAIERWLSEAESQVKEYDDDIRQKEEEISELEDDIRWIEINSNRLSNEINEARKIAELVGGRALRSIAPSPGQLDLFGGEA